jgi:hypothetical protein
MPLLSMDPEVMAEVFQRMFPLADDEGQAVT